MGHRLYLPAPLCPGEVRALSGESSHYVSRVLRLKPGTQLACFDGTGREFAARVENGQGKGKPITLLVGELLRQQLAPPPGLHLAIGWLKGQAMDVVVQKATELGVSDLWPINAARSNVKINSQRTAARVLHWRKIATHAAEQSTRLVLPAVHQPTGLSEFLASSTSLAKILFHPGNPPMSADLPYGPLVLLVGPEGGWTNTEVRAATDSGANTYGLGDRILRAETAPLAALACVHQLWGWR